MPKIKPIEIDDDIFDTFIESVSNPKPKKNKKKGKKKKLKKKNKKKGRKKKLKKNNNKKKDKKNVKGYIGNSSDTANRLYSYQANKSFVSKIFDGFNVNLDSKIDVSIKDETIAAAINIGAALLKSFLTKK